MCRPQIDGLQATKIARQAMGFGDAQPPRRGDGKLRDMNSKTEKACGFVAWFFFVFGTCCFRVFFDVFVFLLLCVF